MERATQVNFVKINANKDISAIIVNKFANVTKDIILVVIQKQENVYVNRNGKVLAWFYFFVSLLYFIIT